MFYWLGLGLKARATTRFLLDGLTPHSANVPTARAVRTPVLQGNVLVITRQNLERIPSCVVVRPSSSTNPSSCNRQIPVDERPGLYRNWWEQIQTDNSLRPLDLFATIAMCTACACKCSIGTRSHVTAMGAHDAPASSCHGQRAHSLVNQDNRGGVNLTLRRRKSAKSLTL